MTLEESTAWAEEALVARDLEAVVRALHARKEAIAHALNTGHAPPRDAVASIIEAGGRLGTALEALKRELKLESARLQHIQEISCPAPPHSVHLNFRG